MIDLHAHVLPGVDDGPADDEESLALVRVAAESGTTTLVATPHIDHRWKVDPRQVAPAVAALGTRLAPARLPIRLVAGGELAATRAAELDPEDLAAVALGGGPWVLLECPHIETGGLLLPGTVLRLRELGFKVLLAHPERSPDVRRNPRALAELMAPGVACSITAASLSGRFGGPVRRLAVRLLAEGLVHNVSSDAHDDRRRPPGLERAREDGDGLLAGLRELWPWLTEETPAAILAGEDLPTASGEVRRRALARLRLR